MFAYPAFRNFMTEKQSLYYHAIPYGYE